MKRKEQIDKAALEYAQSRSKDRGIAYLTFKDIAEWADRTMIEIVRKKLQDSVYDRYFEMHEDYIDDFCKSLIEE